MSFMVFSSNPLQGILFRVGRPGLRNTVVAPPMFLHDFFSILPLGEIGVVSPTPETHGVGVVRASAAKGVVVVELERSALRAAPTLLVDEPALIPIPFPYGAPHSRWDIS
jgi:hypothetical protein